jgi:hypothetical protein
MLHHDEVVVASAKPGDDLPQQLLGRIVELTVKGLNAKGTANAGKTRHVFRCAWLTHQKPIASSSARVLGTNSQNCQLPASEFMPPSSVQNVRVDDDLPPPSRGQLRVSTLHHGNYEEGSSGRPSFEPTTTRGA